MRRKKTKIISFIFTLFILFWIFHTPFLRAWRIIFPPSHEFIALQAYGYIKEKLPKEKRKVSYVFDVIDGSQDPDIWDIPNYIIQFLGVKKGGNPDHLYNPETREGKAIEKSKEAYKEMVENLKKENFTKAFRWAGRISHYVADINMPFHTHWRFICNPQRCGFFDETTEETIFKNGKQIIIDHHGEWERLLGNSILSWDKFLVETSDVTSIEDYLQDFSGKAYSLYYISGGYFGFRNALRDSPNDLSTIENAKNVAFTQALSSVNSIASLWEKALKEADPHSLIKKCSGTNPGGDTPDDNLSFSDGNSPSENFNELYNKTHRTLIGLAVKKNKKGVIWLNQVIRDYPNIMSIIESEDKEAIRELEENYHFLDKSEYYLKEGILEEELTTPDVGILMKGFHGFTANLLYESLFEPSAEVKTSFSPSIVKDYPVLIIPSGGLHGLENSEQFKAQLDSYVRNGGFLIVFSQQHGYEFSALPTPDGRPITGYGWREDLSCQANSVYLSAEHPVLSGLIRTEPSIVVDGYFENIPENSTVLLRRTKNGMPCAFFYPFGSGYVFVTSMYEDWASTNWQSNSRESTAFRKGRGNELENNGKV